MAVKRTGQYFLGVDVGGTKILAGLFSRSMRLLAKRKIQTQSGRGGDAVVEQIELAIRELVASENLRLNQVRAIGLGAPGKVKGGRVLHAYNIGWEDVGIGAILRRRLSVPMFVENDCNLFALGIHRVELKGEPQTMAALFLGTGIGGGLIIDGKLYRGFNHAAGEFGQMIIDKGGIRASNSFRGSLESLASHVGIARRLRKAVKDGEQTWLQKKLGNKLNGLTSDHLRRAIERRDRLAKRIVREAANETGICVAGIISALGPEYVMLGGGVMETLQRTMLPVIQKTAAAHVLPGTMDGIRILLSTMGEEGGIYGAAVFARDEFRQSARKPAVA